MTAKGDPELTLWPEENDATFYVADNLAQEAVLGHLPDITGGATNYYALSMKTPPEWAAKMTKTVTLGGQVYFK